MTPRPDLTKEAFERLLAWLEEDRERAAIKYEAIRRRLIKIFTCKACTCPEDLADETINRVARKAQEVAPTFVGDPALYFYGVARNVHLEYTRRKPVPEPPAPEPRQESDREYACLERCIGELPARSHDLILQYYREERQARIDCRKELARRLGIAANALRIQIYRIRAILRQCVLECLQSG